MILQKKIKDEVLRVIAFLIILSFCSDSINFYFSSRNLSSFSTVNSFTLLETLGLLYFFNKTIGQKVIQLSIILFAVFFFLTWIFAFIKIGRKSYLETHIAMESIAIIALSVYYFFEQIKDNENYMIYLKPRFWVVLGYLLYTSGTFFFFLYMDSLNPRDQETYFTLNSIFTILKTACLSIAMCMKTNTKRRKFELS